MPDQPSASSPKHTPQQTRFAPQRPNRVAVFFAELKRRQVLKVTGVYVVAAWGLAAGVSEILPTLGVADWIVRYVVIGLFVATPLVALLSWLYEITHKGIERDRGEVRVTDQETVLAAGDGSPVLTATWRSQQSRFSDGFEVGRDERCALQLVDPMISRRHARIERRGLQWWLVDLGSANGTEVDGVKAKDDSVLLRDGSSVVFYPSGPPLRIAISIAESGVATELASPRS